MELSAEPQKLGIHEQRKSKLDTVPSFASPKPHLTTGEGGCKRHELTSLELGTLEVGAGRLQSSRPSWLHSETLSQFTRAEVRGDRKGSCASRLEDDRGG